MESGETVACAYAAFPIPNHFGFFLPQAGITTVKQIRESSFDIRATGRLNRLYVELLKDNPDWGAADRRPDMNHFMARLIFCFFAEDTDIFNGEGLFTATIEQMSARDSSNTHEVIGELFRAMNTPIAERATAKLPRWADVFPYVNGGLFSGSNSPSEDGRSSERPMAVPRFSRIARSYLLHYRIKVQRPSASDELQHVHATLVSFDQADIALHAAARWSDQQGASSDLDVRSDATLALNT